jgi:hypothetical protein
MIDVVHLQYDVWFYVFFGLCCIIWLMAVNAKREALMTVADGVPLLWCWFYVWTWILTNDLSNETDDNKVFNLALICAVVMSLLTTCIAHLVLYSLIVGLLLVVLLQQIPGYSTIFRTILGGSIVLTVLSLHAAALCFKAVRKALGRYLKTAYRCYIYSQATVALGAYVTFKYVTFVTRSADYVYVTSAAMGLSVIRLLYLLVIRKVLKIDPFGDDPKKESNADAKSTKCKNDFCQNHVSEFCNECSVHEYQQKVRHYRRQHYHPKEEQLPLVTDHTPGEPDNGETDDH